MCAYALHASYQDFEGPSPSQERAGAMLLPSPFALLTALVRACLNPTEFPSVCFQLWLLLLSCQTQELPSEQSQKNNLDYQLLQEVPASWNSIYYMLEKLPAQHKAVH